MWKFNNFFLWAITQLPLSLILPAAKKVQNGIEILKCTFFFKDYSKQKFVHLEGKQWHLNLLSNTGKVE